MQSKLIKLNYRRGKMGKVNKTKSLNSSGSSYTDFYYHFFRNILVVTLSLLVISVIALSSIHSSATGSNSNSGSDSVTLTLSTSCTLSSSVITPHNASLNGGQYEEGIGDTRINTYCNDNNGYSIYAIGTSNNVDGNTDLVSDLDEHYNIHTGAYVNGNNIDTSTPSFWGMKLTPGIGTGSSSELTPPTIMNSYNSYNVVPSSYTLVASRTSGTNMTIDTDITGSYFNTTYNIYASSVQPAGSYEGRVKYVMIHPSREHNNIGFNEAFALQGKIPINTESGTYYTMQDMTTDICNAVTVYDENSQTQLADIRDNKVYWVAKLKDGHCWMTQNLNLDLVAYTNEQGQEVMKPLTSNDTDLTDHSLTGAYANGYTYDDETGITTWVPAISAKTINFEGTTLYGWGRSNTAPYSANKTDGTLSGHTATGNYYNWTAVVASNASGSISGQYTNATNSICPKGWRLPTVSSQPNTIINSTNEFARLNYLYNNNSNNTNAGLISQPLYFVQSGYVISGGLYNFTTDGYYRSSTAFTYSDGSYVLFFNENNAKPEYYFNLNSQGEKYAGLSARCLAR